MFSNTSDRPLRMFVIHGMFESTDIFIYLDPWVAEDDDSLWLNHFYRINFYVHSAYLPCIIVRVLTCACACVRASVCMCVFLCVHVRVCMCAYVLVHIST